MKLGKSTYPSILNNHRFFCPKKQDPKEKFLGNQRLNYIPDLKIIPCSTLIGMIIQHKFGK